MTEIASLRLINQQVTATKFRKVKDIVRWMGAMQAQDYPMAKWAIGIRLPHSTDKLIERALDAGRILRTHLLRPTWHYVTADDIYWMLDLSRPQIVASMKFREKWLGITGAIVDKSNRVIEKALSADRHLTRDELIAELSKARIRTNGYRSGHLLMRAELDGIICSGKAKGGEQTYALLEKRAQKRKTLSREESLKELATRYFSSRAPATVQDFARWSGLSMTDARNAFEMIKSNFVPEIINGNTLWLPDSYPVFQKRASAHLLPAFDEFLIAYKDRSAALDRDIEKKLIFENGMFRPTIVINGGVSGLWKRIFEDNRLVVETKLLRAHTRKETTAIQQAAARFADFLGIANVDCRIKG